MSELQNTDTLSLLDRQIKEHPEDASLLIERGKLRWRMGDRGGAMSDYTAASILDPEGPGKQLIEHSNEILDFYNKDLYNP